MTRIARVVLALVLLGVAAFCIFGFLATFEPPGALGLRIVYGTVCVLAVIGAMWLGSGAVCHRDPGDG